MKYFRQVIIQTVIIYGPKITCVKVLAPFRTLLILICGVYSKQLQTKEWSA